MVMTDAHMEHTRQRLPDESAGSTKNEARRRERKGKKTGKQVQPEKLKEHERSKEDMEERPKGPKRSAFLSPITFTPGALIFLFPVSCVKRTQKCASTRRASG
jgi:hypothetical protein